MLKLGWLKGHCGEVAMGGVEVSVCGAGMGGIEVTVLRNMWANRMSRGSEIGLVAACCAEEAGHCLIVDQLHKLATISQHSSRWSAAAPFRTVWLMHEAISCLAWKTEHDEVTIIVM